MTAHKTSKYNIIVNNSDKHIYFNTFTGAKVGLNKNEHETVQNELRNLDEFEKKFPNIFHKFYKSGFIIDAKRNEQEEVMFNKRESVFLDREYWLFLHPTLDCNFNCWYCYEEHPKGMVDEKTYEKIINHINYMSNKISGLHLSWFGGEPLMYFNEIVRPISKYGQQLMKSKGLTFRNTITTNGYYINKSMIKDLKEIEMSSFQITLDGNKEKHDKVRRHQGKPTFDKICGNIIDLCTENPEVNIILRINYDDKTLNHNPEFLTIFPIEIRKNIRIDFQRVWQTIKPDCSAPSESNTELLHWLEYAAKEGFSVAFSKLQPHRHYGCYVDKYYHLEIDHEGKVYKCTAKGYTDDYVVGTLKDDGSVQLKAGIQAKRFCKLTVENTICPDCIYLPMCGGSCSQNIIERGGQESCVLKYTEIPMETSIIKDYEYSRIKKS
ncbi:MAG: hypothetical protein A2W91_13290 [Bacteroidetes bacterium GWF2_38_335]|nr:MAG: hypothetical protein A2W91_13290 [Bacteroidetes bacterium GWF2_38_335]OFY77229.1 MAG: hypothetical protein A2281_14955 [Bacteroidetes bacterium RIFOXYA12_FULL_38_20]HBS85770.1 hypothetical protein [Bacteroidales bacterium]